MSCALVSIVLYCSPVPAIAPKHQISTAYSLQISRLCTTYTNVHVCVDLLSEQNLWPSHEMYAQYAETFQTLSRNIINTILYVTYFMSIVKHSKCYWEHYRTTVWCGRDSCYSSKTCLAGTYIELFSWQGDFNYVLLPSTYSTIKSSLLQEVLNITPRQDVLCT